MQQEDINFLKKKLMIRLNAFFEIKDGVTAEQVKALTDELVEKSRKEEGNKGYDLFVSTTNPRVYLFCESWENEAVLEKHKQTAHFTRIIPQLLQLLKGELSLEAFTR